MNKLNLNPMTLDVNHKNICKVEGVLASTKEKTLGDYSRAILSKIIEFTYSAYYISNRNAFLFYFNNNIVIKSFSRSIEFYKNNLIHRDDDSPAIIDYNVYASYTWYKNGFPYRDGKPNYIRKNLEGYTWSYVNQCHNHHKEDGACMFESISNNYHYALNSKYFTKYNYFLVML